MNIKRYAIYVLAFASLLFGNAISDQIVSGKYVSSDGKYQHIFKESGEYSGRVKITDIEYSVLGLYRQGSEICIVSQKDGSQGATGNVMLYVDKARCCLKFQQISNKFAVSRVWMEGGGIGYFLCNDQTLIKKKE